MKTKQYFLKIASNKNNIFVSITNSEGVLLTYKSLKEKKTKDLKSKMTWGLILILKRVKYLKIKYLNLNIINVNINIIQQIFSLFKTLGLIINNIKYDLKSPHNGCRKSRKSRKRNKSRKKSKNIV